MKITRLWPALLMLIIASAPIVGFEAGAQEFRYRHSLPNAGGETAWSPDGTMLATTWGKNVSVINVVDGSILMRLIGHASIVSSLGWSPDGSRIATGALDRTVRIWDVGSGTDLLNINVPDAISSVAWSPDGRHIAASHGNMVTILEAADGTRAAEFEENATVIFSLAWSPDGSRLAAAGAPAFLQLYDMANYTRAMGFLQLTSSVQSLAWSPDGSRIVTGSEKAVRIWNSWTAELERTLASAETKFSPTVAWSPDGAKIAACLETSRTPIWNSTTGKVVQTIASYGTGMSFSPDGGQIAINSGFTVYIYGLSGGLLLRTFAGHSDSVNSLSWSPDGKWLATGSNDNTVKMWDFSSGEERSTFTGHGGVVRWVRWSPDGTRIASAADGGGIIIWDPHTLVEEESLNGSFPFSWSPDGRFLASSGPGNGTILIWDVASGVIERQFCAGEGIMTFLSWSPDGERLAASSLKVEEEAHHGPGQKRTDSVVSLWDADDGTQLGNISGNGRKAASPIAWSPDGEALAISTSDYDISIVDPVNLSIIQRAGYIPYAKTIAWCSDGKKLAFSLVYQISVWNISMMGPSLSFGESGQGTTVNTMAWSPTGALLATGSEDGLVKIWGPIGENPQLHLNISASSESTWAGERTELSMAVTDGSGAPVEGTLVVISSSEGEISAVTESGGGMYRARFTAPEVRSNTTIVISASARKSGFVPAWSAVSVDVRQNRPPVITVMSFTDTRASNTSMSIRLFAEAYDPEGMPLDFSWSVDGAALSREEMFTAELSPGGHNIVLVVSDGHGNDTGSFSIVARTQPLPPAAPPAVPAPAVGASITIVVSLS